MPVPPIEPAENETVDETFERYFQRGFPYADIQDLILKYHGINISLSALRKRRERLGLIPRKGKPQDSREVICVAIDNLLPQLSNTVGYRNVTSRLRQLGYDVRQRTVMEILQEMDPEGVALRKRRRLVRRQYQSPGPNFCWHIDGYDKLKPYGFAIHGAIDGYSRKIIWLEVGSSNNNPRLTARYYMESVQLNKGTAMLVCTDRGTENQHIAALQCQFRRDGAEPFADLQSHRYVKSSSNQRIESWWSIFRRDGIEWWINYFRGICDNGYFSRENENHLLRYTFMPVIKKYIQDSVDRWNGHRMQGNNGARSPSGIPEVLHALGDDYIQPVPDNMIEFGFGLCEEQGRSGSAEFDEYAAAFYLECGWEDATSQEVAFDQYITLRDTAEG